MKLTQTQRVIRAAKSFRGMTQVDFLGTHTIDGGPPITRVAARIQDARDEGHEFEHLGTRDSCKVYRWVSGPDVEARSGEEKLSRELIASGNTSPAAGLSAPESEVMQDLQFQQSDPQVCHNPDRLFDPPSEPTGHWQKDAA